MAKEKVLSVKSARPKSAKQLAQKERNIALYNARCERIKRKQLADNFARQQSLIAAAQEQKEQQFIVASINGPSALILKKWLKGRNPTFERVNRFFDERPHMVRVAGLCLKVA